MRTDFSSVKTYKRAVGSFCERLRKGGVQIDSMSATGACLGFASAMTKQDVLDVADKAVSYLGKSGFHVSKDLVLESAAAFFGMRTWDALAGTIGQRFAQKPAAIPNFSDIIRDQEKLVGGTTKGSNSGLSVRSRFVVTSGGWEFCAHDKDPESRCIVSTRPEDSKIYLQVIEGHGELTKVLEEICIEESDFSIRSYYVDNLAEKWDIDRPMVRYMLRNLAEYSVVEKSGGKSAWSKKVNAGGEDFTVELTDEEGRSHNFGRKNMIVCSILTSDGSQFMRAVVGGVDAALSLTQNVFYDLEEKSGFKNM